MAGGHRGGSPAVGQFAQCIEVGVERERNRAACVEQGARDAEIRALVRDIPAHPENCALVRRFVEERDGVGFAARRLSEWVERAVRALDAFPESQAREYLAVIARYNEWRQV